MAGPEIIVRCDYPGCGARARENGRCRDHLKPAHPQARQ